jgi:hypothetical protein
MKSFPKEYYKVIQPNLSVTKITYGGLSGFQSQGGQNYFARFKRVQYFARLDSPG